MRFEPDDVSAFRPIILEVVRSVLVELNKQDAMLHERIGLTEAEAAAALGVKRHVLGDCRRRGEIAAQRVGKKFIYSRASLLAWLASA